MAENTAIEWATHTFNPWWGCVKVSEACRNCYAATFAKRVGQPVWGPTAERRFFGDKHWVEPVKWHERAAALKVRQRVFCASMADVLEKLPQGHPSYEAMGEARRRLYKLIELTPWLDWLLLTKRPENFGELVPNAWLRQCPDNVWFGTTAEDEQNADTRVPWLLQIPARIRFLSCEPLLGAIDLRYLQPDGLVEVDCLAGTHGIIRPHGGRNPKVDWVIVGGESGPGARPMDPAWARSLRDQCLAAGVAFHFKQWGAWAPMERPEDPLFPDGVHRDNVRLPSGTHMRLEGKKGAGRLLGGRTWDEFPAEVR